MFGKKAEPVEAKTPVIGRPLDVVDVESRLAPEDGVSRLSVALESVVAAERPIFTFAITETDDEGEVRDRNNVRLSFEVVPGDDGLGGQHVRALTMLIDAPRQMLHQADAARRTYDQKPDT